MSRWRIAKNDYLIHYGIEGMKWGVRNFIDENGHLTEAGKKRYSNSGSGSYTPSEGLNKKKQAIESAKERIKVLTSLGSKNSAATQEREKLKAKLDADKEEYNNAKAAERAAYNEQKRTERESLRREQSNLKSISDYIRGNKRLVKTLERNENMRFKSGQNKKIDFEQLIGNYNNRSQSEIDARKKRNAANKQNLKNENERLRNMDVREATSESNMAKIRNKFAKKRK